MESILRVEPACEQDIPRLMQIVIPAMESYRYDQLVGNTNTPENLKAAGGRHLRAWREHATQFATPMGIKCIHHDPQTGHESIIASAEWVIYDKARSEGQYLQPNYLLSASWVEDSDRKREAVESTARIIETRVKWFAGKPHGVLMYMVTDPGFQRRGAATACVNWGLERCMELGIPAYLEASEAGTPVYKRLGFEEVERVPEYGQDTMIPIMIKWPPGTRSDVKVPALPS